MEISEESYTLVVSQLNALQYPVVKSKKASIFSGTKVLYIDKEYEAAVYMWSNLLGEYGRILRLLSSTGRSVLLHIQSSAMNQVIVAISKYIESLQLSDELVSKHLTSLARNAFNVWSQLAVYPQLIQNEAGANIGNSQVRKVLYMTEQWSQLFSRTGFSFVSTFVVTDVLLSLSSLTLHFYKFLHSDSPSGNSVDYGRGIYDGQLYPVYSMSPSQNQKELLDIYDLMIKNYVTVMVIYMKPFDAVAPVDKSAIDCLRKCKILLEVIKIFTKGPYAAALKVAIEAPSIENKKLNGKHVVFSSNNRSVFGSLVNCVLSYYRALVYDDQKDKQSEHCCSLILSCLLKCSKYVVQYFNRLSFTHRICASSLCVLPSDWDAYAELGEYLSCLCHVMHLEINLGTFLGSVPTSHPHVYGEVVLQHLQSCRGLVEVVMRRVTGSGAARQCYLAVVALHESVCITGVPLMLSQDADGDAVPLGVGWVKVILDEILAHLQYAMSCGVEVGCGLCNNIRIEGMLGLLEMIFSCISLQSELDVSDLASFVSAALQNAWDMVFDYSTRHYSFPFCSRSISKEYINAANQLKSILFCSLVRSVESDRDCLRATSSLLTDHCACDRKLRTMLCALQGRRQEEMDRSILHTVRNYGDFYCGKEFGCGISNPLVLEVG